jgi:ubiquinone/menaquinone biosynthesis C-methylase UbiE
MSSEAIFDSEALQYDQVFSYTSTGRLMRQKVRDIVLPILPSGKVLRILEINCGTGEDSLWFSSMGHEVLGTDISNEMIRVSSSKSIGRENLEFQRLGFSEINQLGADQKFDIIFSNFGGLNCIDQEGMKSLFTELNSRLQPGGKFIAVVMPRFCLWESFYFLARFRFNRAFCRLSRKPVKVNLTNDIQQTWYHSPRDFRKSIPLEMKRIEKRPVGVTLPPSYLDPFFSRRPRMLHGLSKVETWLSRIRILSAVSDHYLIAFEKQK